jgi:hypothetical protein
MTTTTLRILATTALFNLTLLPCQALPANNMFANRIILTGTNIVATGSNVGATKEPGEPDHAGDAGGASVWWQWTAPSNCTVTITTAGSSFDTLLGVYTGSSVSALTTIASNDDDPATNDFTSKVVFGAIANQAYQIAVDGYGADSGSVQLQVKAHLAAVTHYVSMGSQNPQLPFTTWATAATNIQQAVDALDASEVGDNIVVSNGVYAGGVGVGMALTLRSVNGPQFTVIKGGDPCVSLAAGASLTGFTLTNAFRGVSCASTNAFLTNCVIVGNGGGYGGGANGGTLYGCTLAGNATIGLGGGAFKSILYNCTLSGNSVTGSWFYFGQLLGYLSGAGGGAYESTLYNCTLTGNSSSDYGGGASYCTLYNCLLRGNTAAGGLRHHQGAQSVYVPGAGSGTFESTLFNCTLAGNSATDYGGGAYGGALYNCIVYFNTASDGANYYTNSALNYCCTTPLPTNGVGNITNAPLFVDYAGGNLRLQSNSPCINAGNNAYVTNSTDLDGRPRIVGGTVDISAYEFQGAGFGEFTAWLQQYGLPTDGSADFLDSDGDGHNNWQEWRCWTVPTNCLSVLKMTSAISTNDSTGLVVTWQSVNTRTYYLQRNTNLAAQPAFFTIHSNIVGQTGTTSYRDTTATNADHYFYRVGVQ